MKNFRTLGQAVAFYRSARTLAIPRHLKEQLLRAAASIVTNLSEGRGKPTTKDQLRFFAIAMGSTRECQALLLLADLDESEAAKVLDCTAAHLHRLMKNAVG